MDDIQLKIEPQYLTCLQVRGWPGLVCATVSCPDFDAYQALPQAVSYNGTLMGLTGWNSDTGHVYYQSNALLVKKV
jgi:hypothetical protein